VQSVHILSDDNILLRETSQPVRDAIGFFTGMRVALLR